MTRKPLQDRVLFALLTLRGMAADLRDDGSVEAAVTLPLIDATIGDFDKVVRLYAVRVTPHDKSLPIFMLTDGRGEAVNWFPTFFSEAEAVKFKTEAVLPGGLEDAVTLDVVRLNFLTNRDLTRAK